MTEIRVLVVEDEPVAPRARRVRRPNRRLHLPATAPDGQSALRLLNEFALPATPWTSSCWI